MKNKLLTSLMSISLLAGCQVIDSSAPENNIPKGPDLSLVLEGTKHRVWKEAAYVGVRSELKEGEMIVFRDVVARPSYNSAEYFYLGHIYSTDGQLLFDKKYSLADVGVIDFKGYEITKGVDLEAVYSERGVRYHGNAILKGNFSTTYWKTTGGDDPRATPVRDYQGSPARPRKVAETQSSHLRLSCIGRDVYVGFSNDENIYAAINENITVTVLYPYSTGKIYLSKSDGHTGVSLQVDSYIERILLEESAIKLTAYSHSNRDFTRLTAYNNGLAEAYSRVRHNCLKR